MIDQKNILQKPYPQLFDFIFLIIGLGCLFFALLGARPLFVPDEGRYAEIIREMVASGNIITPYLNGIKYFEKPILFYWLGSLAVYLNGLNLWSIRGVNAFLGLLGCLITYFTTATLYDRKTGLFAAFILGTSTLYFVMAHMISLDMAVTFFITAGLYLFLLGFQTTHKHYLYFSAVSIALAVLTKGLIGIIFPILIVFLWLTFIREWRSLKYLHLHSCILIFLIIVAPWHILVQLNNPEFFNFYFVEQHILRYFTKTVGHDQPVWYFIPILIIGFFPWIVFLPQTISDCFSTFRTSRTQRIELFFLLWAGSIFLFFSFSKSKLIPYILPIFPPLAILVARYLVHRANQGIKIGYIFLIVFAIIITFIFYHYTRYTLLPNPQSAYIYLVLAGSVLIIGNFASLTFFIRSYSTFSFTLTVTTMYLFLLIILAAIPAIDTRTIQPLALTLKPLLQPHDEIITYNQYFQDLPFYLERRVSILNWRNELDFGMHYQNTTDWMIHNQDFWKRWNSKQHRVFVVMSLDEYDQFKLNIRQKLSAIRPCLMNQTITNVLISNKAC